MQRITASLIGFLALGASLPAAALDSRVDQVTIHPGSLATLERTASAQVEAGEGRLVIDGLASTVDTDSVDVSVQSGAINVGAVETATEAVGETPRQRERDLRQQIEELEKQRQKKRDLATSARSQIRFIEGLSQLPQQDNAAEALLNNDASVGWEDLWQRIGNGSQAAHERLRSAERDADGLNERINTLQQRLEKLGDSGRVATTVTVPYRAQQATDVSLRISYRVRGPQWQPRYEARLDTTAGEIQLVRSATVRQATGTDWRDVQVRLSTVQPIRGERPEPGTWWVNLRQQDEQDSAQADGTGEAARLTASAQAAPRKAEASRTVNAEFAATYDIAERVDVPAGNQPRTLRIGSHSVPGKLVATIYPQKDDRAWLTATATWKGDGPLPEGEMAVFRDDAYVGKQQLATWAPGEKRELAFGVDPRMALTFEPVRDEAGATGWINTQSTLARYYRLSVTNRHERELPIRVLFRVPVGRHDAIEISEDFSMAPDERNIDARQGIHRWVLDLDAGQSKGLDLGFKLAYPEEAELTGM